MKTKEFVDSLFKGYEESDALSDFKEELHANLNAKIESFVKKGMDEEAAFSKACAELGDVSALADELSLKKRKEVFEEVYLDIRSFMSKKRVVSYVIFGALALFGIISALIVYFATKSIDINFAVSGVSRARETAHNLNPNLNLTAFFSVLLPFLTAAITGFTWLGLTQETASKYPASGKRAAWYALGAGLIAFGIFTMPLVYFSVKINGNGQELLTTVSVIIPFILPGIGILVYLGLTEKDRLKPWAKDMREKAVKHEREMWKDSAAASRFGIFSGAIWIFATGLFLLLGFLIGFKFSWLVFIFAVAVQLLVQGLMSRKND